MTTQKEERKKLRQSITTNGFHKVDVHKIRNLGKCPDPMLMATSSHPRIMFLYFTIVFSTFLYFVYTLPYALYTYWLKYMTKYKIR
jgi:hypothetical protein